MVEADGQLARGTPGTTVTHVPGTGLYDVRFNRSVRGCAVVANLGYSGNHEEFTFVAAVNAGPGHDSHTIAVDVTYPGDIPGLGEYPRDPVLRDNSFHLHVACRPARYAVVRADGTLLKGWPYVKSSRQGVGRYLLDFGRTIRGCAPVPTVQNAPGRVANADQAHLAYGVDPSTLEVNVNTSWTDPVDRSFAVIVTCDASFSAVFPVSRGFFNTMTTLADASACALTASWVNVSPGSTPTSEGYVSTWTLDPNTATVQTKNGGYGIQPGNGVDLVATC